MTTTELDNRITDLETQFSRRIAELEEQVAQLSRLANNPAPVDKTAWWKKIVGIYKDDPEFEEAMRLGREYRASLRPQDEEAAS